MGSMDKTVKTRVLPEGAKTAAPQSNLTDAQERSLELAKKNAQLEEIKSKLLEQIKTIEQLRASLNQEQAKSADLEIKTARLESKVKELSELESQAIKSVELETRVEKLTEALGKISAIAAAGITG